MIYCCNQYYAKDTVHRTQVVLNSGYSFKGTWYDTMHDYVYLVSFQTKVKLNADYHQIRDETTALNRYSKIWRMSLQKFYTVRPIQIIGWISLDSKIRFKKRCNYCFGPLRSFVLWHNFMIIKRISHRIQLHSNEKWPAHDSFHEIHPGGGENTHTIIIQSRSVMECVCVYQCSHALCFLLGFLEENFLQEYFLAWR